MPTGNSAGCFTPTSCSILPRPRTEMQRALQGVMGGGHIYWGSCTSRSDAGRTPRITSYNVCYTKLLRLEAHLLCDLVGAALRRAHVRSEGSYAQDPAAIGDDVCAVQHRPGMEHMIIVLRRA